MYEDLTWEELCAIEDETDPDIDPETYMAAWDEMKRRTDIRNQKALIAMHTERER